MGMGVVGSSEDKANLAPLGLELGISLAKVRKVVSYLDLFKGWDWFSQSMTNQVLELWLCSGKLGNLL